MNTSEVLDYLDALEDNLDDLEESLEPLFATESLTSASRKLPLVDRAQLHVTVVYAVESLLFSYLRLNGVAARSHPVFKELSRVKTYFDKIKEAENGPSKRETMSLDKAAAGRIIKHALAGNDKVDLEERERRMREQLLARRKLKVLEDMARERAVSVSSPLSSDPITPAAEEMEEGEVEVEEGEIDEGAEVLYVPAEFETPVEARKLSKKERKGKKRQRPSEMMAGAASKSKKRKHSTLSKIQDG